MLSVGLRCTTRSNAEIISCPAGMRCLIRAQDPTRSPVHSERRSKPLRIGGRISVKTTAAVARQSRPSAPQSCIRQCRKHPTRLLYTASACDRCTSRMLFSMPPVSRGRLSRLRGSGGTALRSTAGSTASMLRSSEQPAWQRSLRPKAGQACFGARVGSCQNSASFVPRQEIRALPSVDQAAMKR